MVEILAKPDHEVAYQDVCLLVKNHSINLTSIEILAIAANMVGKLIALQDHHTTSPELAMEVVAKNIEMGNQTVVDKLTKIDGIALWPSCQ